MQFWGLFGFSNWEGENFFTQAHLRLHNVLWFKHKNRRNTKWAQHCICVSTNSHEHKAAHWMNLLSSLEIMKHTAGTAMGLILWNLLNACFFQQYFIEVLMLVNICCCCCCWMVKQMAWVLNYSTDERTKWSTVKY